MRDPAITFKYFSNERYWTAMPLGALNSPLPSPTHATQPVVETARCLEQIDESTKVIYGSSHHYGPIKARSCVAIARTREDPAQGVWEHYGSWCDHDAAPDLHSKHHPKRLHPTFGGYRIYAFDSPLLASSAPVKGFDGASCRVVACGEADPGAWVPDMFIRFVAKQVLPTTIALVNKTLKRAPAVPPETVGTVDIHAPDVDSAPAEVGPAVAASAESQKSHAIIERPRAKVGRVAGVVERARRALEWASPFIVTFLFVTSLVALFRDRRRRRARLALM